MSKKDKLVRTTSIIVLCTFISKILGLFRDMITASKFGATAALDAFFSASNVPIILFITIGAAITTTLIPLYNEKVKEGEDKAKAFITNVLNFFILLTGVISVICILFSKYIVILLNPGFHGSQLLLTQKLTIILIPTLIFNAVIYIFTGVLQSENKFVAPALVALPFNGLIILYLLVWGRHQNVVGLTIIYCIATFIQIIPLAYSVKKLGFKYSFSVDYKDPTLRRMLIMLVPVILGTGVQQINSFIERAVATNYGSGSLSALSYAYRVFGLICDIFIMSIGTVIYPRMAKHSASKELGEMKNTFRKSISVLIVFILPMSVLVMVQSRAIIYILFQRGAFNRQATIVTSAALFLYSTGLVAFAIRDITCKAFYALQDTRTPMINSAIAMLVNIILIFVFKSIIGFNGLPLASATTMYVASILLIINIRRKLGGIQGAEIVKTFIKTSAAVGAMVAVIVYLNRFLHLSYTSTMRVLIKISISSIAGLFIFVLIGLLLNIKEIRTIGEISLLKKLRFNGSK